jgi:polyferredoxin
MTIHKFPYLVTSFLAFVGLSTGSMACGWLCPFGLLQDIMHKIKSVKIRVPEKLTGMRYLVLLFLVILLPYITQETWFSKLCPMGTLQAALPWAVWNPIIPVYGEPAVAVGTLGILFGVKIVILLSFLGLFVLAKRPFCRLICPLGAILGFFNRYSFIGIKVDKKDCAGCHSCREKCPVDINVGDDPAASTCVRCFECLDCPNVSVSAGTREIARSGVNEGKANG